MKKKGIEKIKKSIKWINKLKEHELKKISDSLDFLENLEFGLKEYEKLLKKK